MGITIVGVSFGAPAKTQPWIDSQKFPFEVWTDVDKTLATTLGAKGVLPYPKRYTYVLDANAEVVLSYTDVSVGAHPGEVLADVQKLYGDQ